MIKTTEIKDIVSYLLKLFDSIVLLVSWPLGKKGCKGVDFRKVTLKDMMDPDYRLKLAQGNIGVVLGDDSSGLASLDLDDDQGAEEFLALNPDLAETLRSRGARGCNIWFYPEVDVPRSCRLKRDGKPWGEWRYNGCQTIIAGLHPNGEPYTLLCAKPPIRYPFNRIQFPPGVTARFIKTPVVTTDAQNSSTEKTEQQTAHRPLSVVCTPLFTSVHSKDGDGLLETEALETLLAGTIPTEPHDNHQRLFSLARRVKAFELGRTAPFTAAQLEAVFSTWYERAGGFLRLDQAWDEYYQEFLEAYEDLDNQRLRVLGKGKKERVLPLGKHAAEWLQRYITDARPKLLKENLDEPALWIDLHGHRLAYHAFQQILTRHSYAAGIKPAITPHAVRRACATHMLKHGAHPLQLQMLLGHATLKTLSQYLRLTITELQQTHARSNPGQ